MEDKEKKAPEDGKHGVDRFTSNGYGITLGEPKKKEETEKSVDEIEEV